MIDVKVTVRPDARRIDKLVSDLNYVSSKTFLRSLPLAEFRREALEYLKRIFPSSDTGSQSKSNLNEFGYHLVRGWKSELVETSAQVGFRLYHEGETTKRIRTILRALDTGSAAFSYVAREDFTFWGKYENARGKVTNREGWITIVQGRTVDRGAREGLEYTKQTYNYVTVVMLPRLREAIRQRIENRMKRHG